MARYKNIDLDDKLRGVIRHMYAVEEYREVLQGLQAVWDNLSLLGQLSGTGTDMVRTLHVVSHDSAGNTSTTVDHQFWVSPVAARFSHWKLDETSGPAASSGCFSGMSICRCRISTPPTPSSAALSITLSMETFGGRKCQ